MKIANIVISSDLRVNSKFNVVDSFDKIIEGLPTLIVGLDNVRQIDPRPDFLDRKLSDNIFWTFSKKEKRVLFEEDLFYFTEAIYENIIKKTEYIFVDLILFNNEKVKEIFTIIQQMSKKVTLFNKDMVYLYGDDKIFGFDLKQVSYMGMGSDRLLGKIKSLSDVFLDDDKILIEYNNDLEMFDYQIKYIPLLYTMNFNE